MSRRLLMNTFSFESRCFVCDEANTGGMRQQFYLDEDAGRVVAEFAPTADHSGAPNYAHGGASMAVLDDAMAWAVIALKERFGLTHRVEVEFLRPVRVGVAHSVEAWVESEDGRSMTARGELRSPSGKVCVSATARYTVMTLQEAEQAIGAAAGTAASYTREEE
jgi:acyl-coenzyme A thioesterase PaaI-like protein